MFEPSHDRVFYEPLLSVNVVNGVQSLCTECHCDETKRVISTCTKRRQSFSVQLIVSLLIPGSKHPGITKCKCNLMLWAQTSIKTQMVAAKGYLTIMLMNSQKLHDALLVVGDMMMNFDNSEILWLAINREISPYYYGFFSFFIYICMYMYFV